MFAEKFAPPASSSHRKLEDGAWEQVMVKAVWGAGESLRAAGALPWRLGGLAENAWNENRSWMSGM